MYTPRGPWRGMVDSSHHVSPLDKFIDVSGARFRVISEARRGTFVEGSAARIIILLSAPMAPPPLGSSSDLHPIPGQRSDAALTGGDRMMKIHAAPLWGGHSSAGKRRRRHVVSDRRAAPVEDGDRLSGTTRQDAEMEQA